MSAYENIEGPKLIGLIDELKNKKTLVNISLANSPYENLTLVTETVQERSGHHFSIDPPNGIIEAIAESNATQIHCEFTSDDYVTHRFESDILKVSTDALTLAFPPHIQRHQQRDNFRVKVVYESYVELKLDARDLRLPIVNISLGGVYCHCLNVHKTRITEQEAYDSVNLFLTLGRECLNIPVQEMRVARIESSVRPKHFGVAFEFQRLARDSKKLLVQQIYELQRIFLQNRIKSVG